MQVTKDPIGHKGARLTQQITLPGRYLVYVPGGSMTGISRKLPDTERQRLKEILKEIVPEDAGVIVRTAAEGASEEELTRDVNRLTAQWEVIQKKAESTVAARRPALRRARPGDPRHPRRLQRGLQGARRRGRRRLGHRRGLRRARLARSCPAGCPRYTGDRRRVRTTCRIDEQLAKALDRKVWLPSGGSLVIDRTEAMTVVDVNTGKFVGSGGNLEQTVTRNNLEAAEEIVRQLRLRDIGGIIVIDFIDMVLESNRDLVLRRLTECLGRDRTKHQVAEVTSLGLVQMTRKRVGQGLLEVFSEPCEHCRGRGVLVHTEPVDEKRRGGNGGGSGGAGGSGSAAARAAPAATVAATGVRPRQRRQGQGRRPRTARADERLRRPARRPRRPPTTRAAPAPAAGAAAAAATAGSRGRSGPPRTPPCSPRRRRTPPTSRPTTPAARSRRRSTPSRPDRGPDAVADLPQVAEPVADVEPIAEPVADVEPIAEPVAEPVPEASRSRTPSVDDAGSTERPESRPTPGSTRRRSRTPPSRRRTRLRPSPRRGRAAVARPAARPARRV